MSLTLDQEVTESSSANVRYEEERIFIVVPYILEGY